MTESMRHPQLHPPETVLMVVADYGPKGGGWGPAAVATPLGTGPFIYTGPAMEEMTAYACELAQMLAAKAAIETMVVKFTTRETVQSFRP